MNIHEIMLEYPDYKNHVFGEAEIDDFTSALDMFNVGWSEEFSKKVKMYWLKRFYDVPNSIGLMVYFMDDELVAVGSQHARKSKLDLKFVSKEAATKVKQYIVSLNTTTDSNLIDLNADILETFPEAKFYIERTA